MGSCTYPLCCSWGKAVCFPTVLSGPSAWELLPNHGWMHPFCTSQGMADGPHIPVLVRVLRQRAVNPPACLSVYGDPNWEFIPGLSDCNQFPHSTAWALYLLIPPFLLWLLGSWDNTNPRILPFSSPECLSDRDISHWSRILNVLMLSSRPYHFPLTSLYRFPTLCVYLPISLCRYMSPQSLPCKKQLLFHL